MAIKAIFVDINKHLDATIPELGGARRDATALWALFTDTVESLSGRLLVDEAASIKANPFNHAGLRDLLMIE